MSRRLYKNVPVLDSGARGSTTTFVQREIGDVLIAWENEAFLSSRNWGRKRFRSWCRRSAFWRSLRLSIVDKVVDKKGTRRWPKLTWNISTRPRGRKSRPEFLPPAAGRDTEEYSSVFPKIKLVTIDEVFGGWQKAQKTHFADGGIFDQIYRAAIVTRCWESKGEISLFRVLCSQFRFVWYMAITFRKRSVLPGFGLALGYTVVYLSLLVLIPLAATFLKASSLSWPQFWHIATSARALASYRLTLWRILYRGLDQSVLWGSGGLGVGALQLSGKAAL